MDRFDDKLFSLKFEYIVTMYRKEVDKLFFSYRMFLMMIVIVISVSLNLIIEHLMMTHRVELIIRIPSPLMCTR